MAMAQRKATEQVLVDIQSLTVDRVHNAQSKVAVLATSKGAPASDTIIVVERKMADAEVACQLVSSLTVEDVFLHNDKYIKAHVTAPAEFKVAITHPATTADFEKYQEFSCIVPETKEHYQTHVMPYLDSQPASKLQWLYNVLDGVCEADRVVLRDEDSKIGFVLAMDMKWDGTHPERDLYGQAIPHVRGIRTLRDLRKAHVPLLRNMNDQCRQALSARFGVPKSRIYGFVHYYPSYFHFHVHFVVHTAGASKSAGRTHLLDEIILNLEQDSKYYANKVLFVLRKQQDRLAPAHPDDLGPNGDECLTEGSSTVGVLANEGTT
eukprot:m.27954 g.27954  ORF g.27954 m.27954 type:complete len:322 (-) comp8999_c2_seq1:45-1010(-)